MSDGKLVRLMRAIARRDPKAMASLAAAPDLANQSLGSGASASAAAEWFLAGVQHYVNAGDTALHVAAATYEAGIAALLIGHGADIAARNRLGATPLHYACDGGPQLATWDPDAQSAMVAALIVVGADPNVVDKRGVAPLHRAVCELLARGADARRRNGNGSTPLDLATSTTGRGGSGAPEAKREQEVIIDLLRRRGAS